LPPEEDKNPTPEGARAGAAVVEPDTVAASDDKYAVAVDDPAPLLLIEEVT
jgi:hypothetical protein